MRSSQLRAPAETSARPTRSTASRSTSIGPGSPAPVARRLARIDRQVDVPAGGPQDLLAEHRTATPLEHTAVGIDLVGAVDAPLGLHGAERQGRDPSVIAAASVSYEAVTIRIESDSLRTRRPIAQSAMYVAEPDPMPIRAPSRTRSAIRSATSILASRFVTLVGQCSAAEAYQAERSSLSVATIGQPTVSRVVRQRDAAAGCRGCAWLPTGGRRRHPSALDCDAVVWKHG